MKTDIIIAGGGLVGTVLAIALAKEGFDVAVADKEALSKKKDPSLDGRTIAVSYASYRLLNNLGIWGHLKDPIQPINEIRVFEQDSPWHVDFNPQMVEDNAGPMGYVIHIQDIRSALELTLKQVLKSTTLKWMENSEVLKVIRSDTHVESTFSNGTILQAPLIIGSEGRFSPLRESSTISVVKRDYKQSALVCLFSHEKPHNGVAWEIFTPLGPFAVLPMPQMPNGISQSGLVWSADKITIENLNALDDQALSQEIESVFPYYGACKLHSKRWTYPLTAMVTSRCIDKRLALIGDAAHVLHPVAGQGVNLGWQDVAHLYDVLVRAKSFGLDLGQDSVLQEYKKSRQAQTWQGFFATHGIVKLFSNDSRILSFMRNAGFAAVNQLPPLKRFFMKKAMGLSSNMPYLMRG